MNKPLLARSVAIWMVDNTSLTFEQIADYCHMHVLEIQAIANGEIGSRSQGTNPIIMGELTSEEIAKCEQNPSRKLQGRVHKEFDQIQKQKKPHYTFSAMREHRQGAILWLVKNNPELSDSQIAGLLHSTSTTVKSIRTGTHANFSNIIAVNPMQANLVSSQKYHALLRKVAKKTAEETAEVKK